MKDVVGSPGTRSGLALRVSQFVCSLGSLVAMMTAFGFSNYSAYLHLTFVMALEIIWSIIAVCIDICALINNLDLHTTGHVWKYVLVDWILGFLSFTAATSGGGLAILMLRDVHFCDVYPYLACSRYKISVIFAFMAWSFLATSAVSTFWLLGLLYQ